MIRSDYLCKRTVMLDNIYFCTFVLGLVLRNMHCEGSCIGLYSTASDVKNYTPVGSFTPGTAIVFSVEACNDVHIGLSSSKDEWRSSTYEIVIGGWKNTQSVIRRVPQGNNETTNYDKNKVDCNSPKDWWVTYDSGNITVGEGTTPAASVFMTWTDGTPHVDINYFGIHTGFGATGDWCIKSGVTIPGGCEVMYRTGGQSPTYQLVEDFSATTPFAFKVTARSDVFIALSNTDDFTGDAFEIRIGCFRNTSSVIRKCGDSMSGTEAPSDIRAAAAGMSRKCGDSMSGTEAPSDIRAAAAGMLKCQLNHLFWISHSNGTIAVGTGLQTGENEFMTRNFDTAFAGIEHIGIRTLSDTGVWCFGPAAEPNNETQTTEETSPTADSTVTTTTPPTSPPLTTQITNKPNITNMTPSYGPVSGGTEVNITGSYLGSITELWLGSNLTYELNFTLMESGYMSAVTPNYTGPGPNETGVALNVTIQMNDLKVTDIQFTYKPDPQVFDIYPRKMTKSGGLTVTVEGSSLDSVAAPMLTVTVIKRSDPNQRKTYDSPCKAETPKQLLCVTPEIPENPFSTKRKRHTTDNRRRRQSNDEELDFVLGLQFDGADNYEDLTDNLPHLAHIEVHQDPSFIPDQMFSFDPEFAGAIGIKGENIDAGVVVADYNVSIGKGFCTNIGITSDKLYCNPPLTLDEVTDGNSINTTRAHNEVDITVRVGTNLVYTVGYIVYDIEETISLYTIFVPVVAALGALLVVFVIILIVCCCRKARAKKDSDKTLAPSAQDLNTLEPSRNDNYYTDETQPKNQYYMVVNQGANGQ